MRKDVQNGHTFLQGKTDSMRRGNDSEDEEIPEL